MRDRMIRICDLLPPGFFESKMVDIVYRPPMVMKLVSQPKLRSWYVVGKINFSFQQINLNLASFTIKLRLLFPYLISDVSCAGFLQIKFETVQSFGHVLKTCLLFCHNFELYFIYFIRTLNLITLRAKILIKQLPLCEILPTILTE